MKVLFFFFLLLTTLPFIFSKGGGGRGGGGRGFGGARGRRAIYLRNPPLGEVRSGSSGTKIGSASAPGSFGSSSFRSATFYSSLYFYHPIGRPYVITSGSAPIPYDNRTYHWSAQDANKTYLESDRYYIICQYDIGKDDGQLQNVTFANGTHPTSLFFGCFHNGKRVACCGMYCCEDNSELYFGIGFLSFLASLFMIVGCWRMWRRKKMQKARKQEQEPIADL